MLSHALIGMLEGQYHRRLISTGIITPSIEVSFPITISTEPMYHGLMDNNPNPSPMKINNQICPDCGCIIRYPCDTPSGRGELGTQWGVCSPDCSPFGDLIKDLQEMIN